MQTKFAKCLQMKKNYSNNNNKYHKYYKYWNMHDMWKWEEIQELLWKKCINKEF